MQEIKGVANKLILGQKAEKAYQRDPSSIMDETLLSMWGLLILCILFTVGFGYYFHFQNLKTSFETPIWAAIGSFGIFVVIEIVTVIFGLALARILFSGLWFRSFLHLSFMVLMGFLTVAGFRWSINISTQGVARVNEMSKKTSLYQEEKFMVPPSVEEIDRKIAEMEAGKRAGAKSTWKGRTTKEGLALISEINSLQKGFLAQREAEMKNATARFDSMQTVKLKQIQGAATLLADYGGKAEYAKIILILLIVIFEFINWRKNTQDPPTQQSATQHPPTQQPATQQQPTQNPIVWNETKRPIGFAITHTPCDTSSVATQPPTQSPPKQPPTQPAHSQSIQVVLTPSEDISKVKNYARVYFQRSRKQSSSPETIRENQEKYLQYKRILEIAGYTISEYPETGMLKINNES